MRSSLARSPRPSHALCALACAALVSCGTADDLAPPVPPDYNRQQARVPGSDTPTPSIVTTFDAGAAQCDQQRHELDAGDAAVIEDTGVGCTFVQCMPGFLCCQFDGRCYPVSCFDCCSFFPDAGPDSFL